MSDRSKEAAGKPERDWLTGRREIDPARFFEKRAAQDDGRRAPATNDRVSSSEQRPQKKR
jgi:hypothetical protein